MNILIISIVSIIFIGTIIYYTNNSVQCKDPNEERVNNECQCIKGYNRDDKNNCVQLSPQSCNPNEKMVNNECQCIKGYNRDDTNNCVQSCNRNEERVNNECQCVKGYDRYGNNKCVPSLTISLYGHYSNPIFGYDYGAIEPLMFDDTGVFYNGKNVKQIAIFDGYVGTGHLICCDINGKVYYTNLYPLPLQLDWKTFDVKEKAYCRFNYFNMVVTLTGNIFKNEQKITSLSLNKDEKIVDFSTSFIDQYQVIFTSEGRVYISIDNGDTWTLDKTIFKLKKHQLKCSILAVTDFYLISDMKLYKLAIDSGIAVYTQIMTDFKMISFDIYGQSILNFCTDKIISMNNWVDYPSIANFVLTNNIPDNILDIKQYYSGLFISTTSGDVYKCNYKPFGG